MSAAKMVADSTQSDMDVKKKKKKIKKGGKKLLLPEDEDSDLDLKKEVKPIGDYVKDRAGMIEEMFRAVRGASLQRALPDLLKSIPLDELKELCREQLEVMSKKRIRRILAGEESANISSSGTEDDTTDEENALPVPNPPQDPEATKQQPDTHPADSTSIQEQIRTDQVTSAEEPAPVVAIKQEPVSSGDEHPGFRPDAAAGPEKSKDHSTKDDDKSSKSSRGSSRSASRSSSRSRTSSSRSRSRSMDSEEMKKFRKRKHRKDRKYRKKRRDRRRGRSGSSASRSRSSSRSSSRSYSDYSDDSYRSGSRRRRRRKNEEKAQEEVVPQEKPALPVEEEEDFDPADYTEGSEDGELVKREKPPQPPPEEASAQETQAAQEAQGEATVESQPQGENQTDFRDVVVKQEPVSDNEDANKQPPLPQGDSGSQQQEEGGVQSEATQDGVDVEVGMEEANPAQDSSSKASAEILAAGEHESTVLKEEGDIPKEAVISEEHNATATESAVEADEDVTIIKEETGKEESGEMVDLTEETTEEEPSAQNENEDNEDEEEEDDDDDEADEEEEKDAEGAAGGEDKGEGEGMDSMELLELEMRARAIKAMLSKNTGAAIAGGGGAGVAALGEGDAAGVVLGDDEDDEDDEGDNDGENDEQVGNAHELVVEVGNNDTVGGDDNENANLEERDQADVESGE